jgi:hypothetical protein
MLGLRLLLGSREGLRNGKVWAFPVRPLSRPKAASPLWGASGAPTVPKRRELVVSGTAAIVTHA